MKNRNPSRGPGRQLSNLYDGIIVEFCAADRPLPSMATFSEREGKLNGLDSAVYREVRRRL